MKELTQIADDIINMINSNFSNKDLILIGIDGRCAAGKTTLAAILNERMDCNVIHMDDFFLRPEQRTAARLATPGENVDHERFLREVLIPLSQGNPVCYRPFNCHTMSFDNEICIPKKRINIVEGSYSCHSTLRSFYDLRIFLDIDSNTQMERIIRRNGKEIAEVFRTRWIPMEERYFEALRFLKH